MDVVVVLAAAGLIAALGWFFFGPRRAGAARVEGGVQRVEVTVRGGYNPSLIKVRQGTSVELVFDRQESGECTSRESIAGVITPGPSLDSVVGTNGDCESSAVDVRARIGRWYQGVLDPCDGPVLPQHWAGVVRRLWFLIEGQPVRLAVAAPTCAKSPSARR
ncbi:hypothetical protein ACFPH6_02970 [Streptomyces xiangluensis]|uniref:Uncharacterized protein n=1 Tax=Streptomyces xiangluensis TaxID=2665720 RepID=A0ABV8YHM2_9ACTN